VAALAFSPVKIDRGRGSSVTKYYRDTSFEGLLRSSRERNIEHNLKGASCWVLIETLPVLLDHVEQSSKDVKPPSMALERGKVDLIELL
jgi:hypothetical protein